MLVIAIGLMTGPIMGYLELKKDNDEVTVSSEKLDEINTAIKNFVTEHGRYPCPASLTSPLDSADFGKEEPGDCTTSAKFAVATGEKDQVLIGAVPVRTLGLPDGTIVDGYGHRYLYAITKGYATPTPVLDKLQGAVSLIDSAGNNATETKGNIIYTVMGAGYDDNGSYNLNGKLLKACDVKAVSGENCNMDATFKNTLNTSYANDQSRFTQTIAYDTSPACAAGKIPKKVAYLIDTSTSMEVKAPCSKDLRTLLGKDCRRIDVAHWALRRIIPARTVQAKGVDDATTELTPFVGIKLVDILRVLTPLTDISISDTNLESKLSKICTNSRTPLLQHISVLADRLGDGEPDRPNAVVVLSDGEDNESSMTPEAAGRSIHAKYPNLKVHVVDMSGAGINKGVAAITGGEYISTTDPNVLVESLYKFTGGCMAPPVLAPVVDKAAPKTCPK